MTLPQLNENQIPNQNQLPIAGANLSRPFVRKTVEELHNEYITSLVQDRDFHQPTISFLAKCNQVKLPILCDKCLETATHNDEYTTILNDDYVNEEIGTTMTSTDNNEQTLKPIVGTHLTYLSPCGTCEYNKKLCIVYNTRRKSIADSMSPSPSSQYYASPIPVMTRGGLKSAPLKMITESGSDNSGKKPVKHVQIQSRPETGRLLKRENQTARSINSNSNSNSSSSSATNSRTSNYSPVAAAAPPTSTYTASAKKKKLAKKGEEKEAPMLEGDIRYKFTKSGLEIKRLNSKNSLVIDIFTPDVCKDQNEKSYADYVNRQREDEDRKNQKYPSQIYEKQLREILANIKKGPLTHELWARQSWEILLLRDKIKRAKRLEDAETRKREAKAKSQEVLNTYQLWKINKEFARYRAATAYPSSNNSKK